MWNHLILYTTTNWLPLQLLEKASTSSNSQSWICLVNLGFQHPPSPICSHILAMHAFLVDAIKKSMGKVSPKVLPSHYLSSQNFTLCPFPTLKSILFLKSSHLLPIAFHTPIPNPALIPQEHHPSTSSPYFPKIIYFQKESLLQANFHYHLPSKALLRVNTLLTPKPLLHFSWKLKTNFTIYNLILRASAPQRKSLWIFSKLNFLGIVKRDMK